jgi:sulfite exporter TauE/SafE
MDPIHTATGAFVAGLATSLHCAGMCGPVSCSLMSLKQQDADPQTAAVLYHLGRLLSYAGLGALAGALGRWPLMELTRSPVMVLPWLLAAVLLAMACGLSFKLPQPRSFKMWSARTRLRLCRIPAKQGAFTLGAVTPLLPCGPLYLMLAIALASGSALRGVEFMLAFALGTVPLLWLAQHQFRVWQHRLSHVNMARVRRGVALVGAVLVISRLWALPSPISDPTAPAVLCHGS